MVDRGDQTPRGLYITLERFAAVKRKLKAARAAHKRVLERLRKLEESQEEGGSRFTVL